MIATIHQPHFPPWMGYLNKVLHSDVFIWLHTVQYTKNNFQNRTRIKNINDQPLWLTLPVHAHLETPIDQVSIADPPWRNRICRTVEQCYGKAPFFDACWPPIAQAMHDASNTLDDVNYRTFQAIMKLLAVDSVRVVKAGEFPIRSEEPTERLAELCAAAGARRYIAGSGGRKYMRLEVFERAGIEIIWQSFHPEAVIYPQRGKVFVPGLSVIDCLFNVGPEITRELILKAWIP